MLGARPGEVVVADSTTVNLFKLCSAALDAYRLSAQGALVTDRDNFPTDRYVLEGLAEQRGLELRTIEADPLDGPQPRRPRAGPGRRRGGARRCSRTSSYRSGALADMRALTELARRYDAHVVWDLSHSAGAVPVRLRDAGVELAVGCTYKYLNAGPGAPAYLYAAAEVLPRLRSPIWGWFGQRDQFAMERSYDPVDGIGRFLAGTPPVLDLAAVEEGVKLTAEAGIERLREKSVALCELIVALHDAWLAPLGFELGSPRDPERRGSHVSLRHPEAWPICRALIELAAVVPDFRGPDSIRLGVAPLYTRFADIWDALDRLRGIVERGDQRSSTRRPAGSPERPYSLLAEHQLLGQRGARRRRRVGDHGDGLGHRARERGVAVGERDDDVLGVDLGDLALLARRQALVLEQVQQILGLVLEPQHGHPRALLDVGQRHALDPVAGVDRMPVRARLRVADRGQHALLELRRHRVLEPLGLLVDVVPGDPQHVGEEALDQPVAADDALRVLEPVVRERRAPCPARA